MESSIDGAYRRAVVLSAPQVTFPFPGEPEINVLCRIDDVEPPLQGVVLENEIPSIGEVIWVMFSKSHYHSKVQGGLPRFVYPP